MEDMVSRQSEEEHNIYNEYWRKEELNELNPQGFYSVDSDSMTEPSLHAV